MDKRGLYSKPGISVVGISLFNGSPNFDSCNELNYSQLSVSPVFKEVHIN